MAKQLLASTPLASQLTNNPLVSVTTGCRMDAAVKTLHDHHILSIPVMNKGVSEIARRGSAGCPVRPLAWRTAREPVTSTCDRPVPAPAAVHTVGRRGDGGAAATAAAAAAVRRGAGYARLR